MNQEIKRQATRLGLIFARHGIELSRAEKLDLIAEIHGHKEWAVAAAEGKAKDATPAPSGVDCKPFTPLQVLAASEYGHGDYYFYRYMHEVHKGDDLLFEYVLHEALEAREDAEEFMGMMRTAINDLQTVVDHVGKHQDAWRTTERHVFEVFHDEELLPQTAVVFADGEVGVRHMATLLGPDGEVFEEAQHDWPATVYHLQHKRAIFGRVCKVASTTGGSVAAYEGQFGLFIERQIYEAGGSTIPRHQDRRDAALSVLRSLEEKWSGCIAGLSVELGEKDGDFARYEDAWVFIPVGRELEEAGADCQRVLAELVGKLAG